MQLLVGKDVSHKAKLGSFHRRQEHVHYDNEMIKL
jgi:hypothetical protein